MFNSSFSIFFHFYVEYLHKMHPACPLALFFLNLQSFLFWCCTLFCGHIYFKDWLPDVFSYVLFESQKDESHKPLQEWHFWSQSLFLYKILMWSLKQCSWAKSISHCILSLPNSRWSYVPSKILKISDDLPHVQDYAEPTTNWTSIISSDLTCYRKTLPYWSGQHFKNKAKCDRVLRPRTKRKGLFLVSSSGAGWGW